MKKLKLTIISVLCLIALKLGIINAIAAFILVGAIPGTQYSLPAGGMLIIFGITIWLLFCQKTAATYVRTFIEGSHHTKQSVDHITRMPRRRFSQI